MAVDPRQVKVGRGERGPFHRIPDHARAWEIAAQLAATERWDGMGIITIHEPYRVSEEVRDTARERFDKQFNIVVRTGIYSLIEGVDFETDVTPAAVEYDAEAETEPRR